MKIDKALKGLREPLGEPAVDIEAGRERLHAAARRLREDPQEARRIDDLAKRIDRCEKDFRLGHAALRRQDYGKAEHYLLRAAGHGNDEAAYWLALLLEMRSTRQRLKGRIKKARQLAAEAREWRLRAQESGIAEALEAPSDTAPQVPLPARPEKPQKARRQPAGSAREDVTAFPARQVTARPEACHTLGIELQPYRLTAVLINGTGEVIGQEARPLTDMKADAVVRAVAAAAREITMSGAGQGFPAEQVALGVQLGGPVDTTAGTVHYLCKYPPRAHSKAPFKWENFPLGPRLQEETGFRAVIMNDAVAFAELEQWRGVGRQTGDFVVMLIREGVGGAVVSDGRLFKGPVEIGQFITYHDSASVSDAETLGALESAAGGTAIAAAASEATGRTINDLQTAIEAANEDGPGRKATVAFKAAGVAASAGLSYLVQFAGPSHVVLYAPEGMIRPDTRAAEAFLDQVRQFRKAVAFEAYRDCKLVLRPIGTFDGAHGAALAALRRCFQAEPTASLTSTGSVR